MNYALVGYGRMGRAVDEQARRRGHERRVVVDPETESRADRPDLEPAALHEVDVAFEFTAPGAAESNVLGLLAAGVPVVCGTTGWKPGAEVVAAAERGGAGAVVAPNFSVGMNLFYRLVREAGRLYGAMGLHQPFIYEAHHRGKLDAPSGTARRLASILLEVDPRLRDVHEGNPDRPLPEHTLQVASVRAGAEPGTHTVGLDGEFDRITLTHAARSRAGFALGAVLAAEWIVGRTGLYGFEELLQSMLDSMSRGGESK